MELQFPTFCAFLVMISKTCLSKGKTGEQLHALQDVLVEMWLSSTLFNVFFIVVLPVVILAFSLPQYV